MGIFNNIEAALNTKLSTLLGLPAIQWPNTRYQPTENTAFIRPTLLPNSTELDTLAGTEKHTGIYQIDVFVPLEKGVSVLNGYLDDIQSLFKSSRVLTETDIVWVQAISRGKAQRQESWYAGFVEIQYLCYSSN